MLSDMRISNSGHMDRACAGLLYAMIGNTDRVTNTEKMLKNFAFRKLPVRHRQDHHHIGAGLLRILCAPDRLCRRPVGNPDHDGHPDSDRRHRGVDDRIELRFIEVCQLAGAAQGRDCVQIGDHQPVDQRTQLPGVDGGRLIFGERSHRSCTCSPVKPRRAGMKEPWAKSRNQRRASAGEEH
jgi:hypothetical protein